MPHRVLTEAGSTYAPSQYLSDNSQVRNYYGSTDPSTIAAVSTGDLWRATKALKTETDAWVYTDLPMVKWSDVYRTGDTGSTVLGSRLTQDCYVDMTDISAELVDFAQSNYAAYAPLCHGIYVAPGHQGILRLRQNSSTKVGLVPAQSTHNPNPLFMLRLGPSNSSVHMPTHIQGLSLIGTTQPVDPNTGLPHAYHGFVDYHSQNSTFVDFLCKGNQGSDNAPPGETFAFSTYYSINPTMTRLEVDGIDESGHQGGAGTASNGGSNVEWDDCYIHDSFVSGMTMAAAGGVTGTNVDGYTTRNVKVWHNANHGTVAAARSFPGLNHEGVSSFIHHYNPDILMDGLTGTFVGSPHIFIGSVQNNVPDVQIIEPNWHPEVGTPYNSNGALCVRIPATYAGQTNMQTTLPVIVKNGVTLQPVARGTAGDWTKQYVLITT